jgi:hypothetical protein
MIGHYTRRAPKMNHTMIPPVPGTFFVALRQDLVLLCVQQCTHRKDNSKASPYCKALILSILDHWTYDNLSKKKNADIHITTNQWEALMYGMFKRKAIMDSLYELCKEGWIERTGFKAGSGGREQYRYTLKHETIIEALARCKNEPCTTEDGSQSHHEGVQMNLDSSQSHRAKGKNEPSSSVARFTSEHLIEEKKIIETPIEEKIEEGTSLPSDTPVSFSPEEADIRQWLTELKVEFPQSKERVASCVSTLKASVQSREQLHKLYQIAQKGLQGKDTIIWLGNLVSERVLKAFQREQEAEQDVYAEVTSTASIAASQEDIQALRSQIETEEPGLILESGEDDQGPFILLIFGERDYEAVEIRSVSSWQQTCGDDWVMERARAYAGKNVVRLVS